MPTLTKDWMPPGLWGTLVTLRRMADLARAGALTSLLRSTVAGMLDTSAPTDSWERATLIRQWMAGRFVFLSDPVGAGVFGDVEDIELLRSPVLMIQQIQQSGLTHGDCDDAAILGASLARATVPSFPARFRVVSFDDGGYSHVFTEVLTSRGWLDLDVTRGANAPSVVRTQTFNV